MSRAFALRLVIDCVLEVVWGLVWGGGRGGVMRVSTTWGAAHVHVPSPCV